MARALTEKQEVFCRLYVETGNATEAYRRSYKPRRMTAKAIGVEASRLMNDPRISLRIAEIRAPAVDASRVTLTSHLAALNALRQKAEAKGNYGAAVSAEALRGKAVGIYDPKRVHLTKERELTPEEKQERIIAILTEGARRASETMGSPAMTELLRLAFEHERDAFVELVKEFLAARKAARSTTAPNEGVAGAHSPDALPGIRRPAS